MDILSMPDFWVLAAGIAMIVVSGTPLVHRAEWVERVRGIRRQFEENQATIDAMVIEYRLRHGIRPNGRIQALGSWVEQERLLLEPGELHLLLPVQETLMSELREENG